MNNYLLAHASNGGETISESLNFTAPQMAGYARRRSHRNIPPQGGSEYGLVGSGKTTTLRFRVSGDEFLDPSTVALKFKITNSDDNNPLIMVAPAYCFFKRFRILVNGYPVEEIDDFHRTCALIDACSSRDAVYGQRIKQGWWLDQVGAREGGNAYDNSRVFVVPFRASGLLNNFGNKFLPLKYLPSVDIELETATLDESLLCANPNEAVNPITADEITISDVRLVYDTVMLDSGIEDDFYKHLEDGGTLDIPFATWRNSRQIMTPSSFSCQVSTNVKSARSLFFSCFKKNLTQANALTTDDMAAKANNADKQTGLAAAKSPNTGAAGMFYRHDINNFEVQVGNQSIPDSPINSLPEFHHYLCVAWNKHHSYDDALGISYVEYQNDYSGDYTRTQGKANHKDYALTELGPYPAAGKLCNNVGAAGTDNVDVYKAMRNYGSRFVVGVNLERLLDLWASGQDLSNEIISIRGTCKQEVATASIMVHYNAILQIGRGLVNVLERG